MATHDSHVPRPRPGAQPWYRARWVEVAFAAALTLAALVLAAYHLSADEARGAEPSISVADAWARPAVQAGSSAAYMTILNATARDDVLIDARARVAETVELHLTIRDGDIVRMRRAEDGFPVATGQSLVLAPGGAHVMLIGLKRRLAEGDRLPLTLRFRHAGEIAVDAVVRAGPASRPPTAHGGHGHGGHGH